MTSPSVQDPCVSWTRNIIRQHLNPPTLPYTVPKQQTNNDPMVLLSGIILGLIVRYRKAMAAQISLPRHNSNAGQPSSTFTMADSQDTSNTTGKRMPRFFKRLFKFPQMDFEMAVWEMTNIVIAPKKVFRSIRYHQRTLDLHQGRRGRTLADLRRRNEKYLAPPRPIIHLPPLVLLDTHKHSLGSRLRRRIRSNFTISPSLCLRTLHRPKSRCSNTRLLPRRQITWSRYKRPTWAKETRSFRCRDGESRGRRECCGG